MAFKGILAITALALTVSSLVAGPIKDGSLTGTSNGSSILVRWLSEDETGVVRIEIERAVGVDGPFININQLQPLGNGRSYEYIDDSAFRLVGTTSDTIYRYRIRAVYSDGSTVASQPISVPHIVSSVRRTWGSIKAMFR